MLQTVQSPSLAAEPIEQGGRLFVHKGKHFIINVLFDHLAFRIQLKHVPVTVH